jgi:hypothetical protein
MKISSDALWLPIFTQLDSIFKARRRLLGGKTSCRLPTSSRLQVFIQISSQLKGFESVPILGRSVRRDLAGSKQAEFDG